MHAEIPEGVWSKSHKAPSEQGTESMDIRSLVFIDGRVTGYEALIQTLGPDVQWHILESSVAGLEQIALVASQYADLASIHIVSHGDAGLLLLGNTAVRGADLASSADVLRAIGASLSDAGDLLLYGCDVGQGPEGLAFIDELSRLTGADVAASNDPTGSVAQGGDAALEVATGFIDTPSLDVSLLPALLVTLTGTDGNDVITGSSGNDLVEGLEGNDTLDGSAGNDTVLGGLGDDSLMAAGGDDLLTGGLGADTFYVEGYGGYDAQPRTVTITDLGNGTDVLRVVSPIPGNYSSYVYYNGYPLNPGSSVTVNVTLAGAWVASSDTYLLRQTTSYYSYGNTYVSSNQVLANLSTEGYAVDLSAVANGNTGFNVTNTGGATTLSGSAFNDTLTGGVGDDTLTGNWGEDFIVGGGGSDVLSGNSGYDVLQGGEGEDTLTGGLDNDQLTGGADFDTVLLTGNRSEYTLSLNGDTGALTVIDNVGGRDGTDVLLGIEYLRFADTTINAPYVNFEPTSSAASFSSNQRTVLQGTLPSASDANGDVISYVLDTAAANGVVVIEPTGAFTYTPNPAFSGTDSFNFAVDDGRGGRCVYTATITVEPVLNAAPNVAAAVVSIPENSAAGALVLTVDAVDPDGDTLSYAIVGGNLDVDGDSNLAFAIDASLGQISINDTGDLDAAVVPSFALMIRASDGDLSDDAAVTVNIIPNRAPDGFTPVTLAVPENSSPGTVVGTITGSDPDGDALVYSLVDSAGGRFAIDAATGVLRTGNVSIDRESAASHGIVARVTDPDGLSVDAPFTVAVSNVIENQSRTLTTAADNFLAPSDDNWSIDALAGNDQVSTGAGADVIRGNSGNDTLSGGGGDDVFTVSGTSDGYDVVQGGDGNDLINALANSTAIGLRSLSGVETISANGKTGVYVRGTTSGDVLDFSTVTLEQITRIDAGSGNDTVQGSAAADTIVGGSGNDGLSGQGGDDTFQVGTSAGSDAVDGGEGADRIVAMAANVAIGLSALSGVEEISANGYAGVRVLGTSAADVFDFSATTLTGITLVDGGSGNDTLTGSAGADTLTGGSGTDVVQAGGGDDRILFGTSTADTVDGGAGTNTLAASATNASIVWKNVSNVQAVTGGSYTGVKILGTTLADTLDFSAVTLSNIALIDGGSGNDTLTGSAGDDTISGGSGTDVIQAGGGDDRILFGTSTADTVDGGTGTNTLVASATNASIVWKNVTNVQAVSGGGYAGVAVLGTTSADTLDLSAVTLTSIARIDGGSGNDTVTGSAGNDTLIGGAGKDVLTGGAGADTFVFGKASDSGTGLNWDLVSDFVVGADRIDLTSMDASTALAGDQAFTYLGTSDFTGVAGQLRMDQGTPGYTRLLGDLNGDSVADFEIRLAWADPLTPVSLTAGDFLL
jgi:Ca2+-binding RTX toxin-like protein